MLAECLCSRKASKAVGGEGEGGGGCLVGWFDLNIIAIFEGGVKINFTLVKEGGGDPI